MGVVRVGGRGLTRESLNSTRSASLQANTAKKSVTLRPCQFEKQSHGKSKEETEKGRALRKSRTGGSHRTGGNLLPT